MTLKQKWAITAGLVIFTTYAIVCIVMYSFIYNWLLTEEKAKVERTLADVTTYINSGPSIEELRRQRGMLTTIVDQQQTVRLFNADGLALVQINDKASAQPLVLGFNEYKVDGERAFVTTMPIELGFIQGYIQLVHPLTHFLAMMRYLLTAMLLAGVVAIVIAVAGGYYLASLFMRPIIELRDAMRGVAKSGFAERTKLPARKDEVGELLAGYEQMMSELEGAFLQQHQFVSDASHELRTPLHAVEGHLSLLKRWGKNDPAVLEESLDLALTETTRMKTMIEELLALARRTPTTEQECTAVNEVIEASCQSIEATHNNVTITLQLSEPVDAAITVGGLTQILQNLLINAVHYSKQDPHIDITTSFTKDMVSIKVADNGIGISEADLPHIFDRFYRADHSRLRIEGSGLGLSIVQMLVHKYKGTISVTSNDGGTTFIVQLPRYKP